MIGTEIAHYRILEKIGGGGMGVVYKAEDLRLGRRVALKFLPDEFAQDPAVIERFRREARAVSALNHPNICTLHDIVEADGRTFLVMELLEGRNLREIILESGALPLSRLLDIAIDVTEGLMAAHEKGILHRDLKPANIVVTERRTAKILDFGLAKIEQGQAAAGVGAVDLESHAGGWAMGTVAYMSPEQALGKPLDQRSDLFSLGAILYEMATGTLAFTGDTTGMLFLSLVQEAPIPPRTLNPDVPEALQRIIGKCMEKDREQRYQGAADLLADLRWLQAAPVPASVQVAGKPSGRLRSWAPWIAGAAVVLLAAAGTIAFAVRGRAPALTTSDTIVVADLANLTGEPVFDGALRPALTIQLGQSPFLNIVSDAKVASTLSLMHRAPGERLTRQLAREVCQRTNSKAYLTGSIGRSGERYILELQALACADDRALASANGSAASREEVLPALDEAGNAMRRELGESLPSVAGLSRPLAEVTTSSLEALQALSTGNAVSREQGYQAAMPYFKRAVELDPNFAAAYVSLGATYSNLQQRDLAAEYYRRAYELRNRVTERERYLIESRQYAAAGDLSRDIEICLQWAAKYPNDDRARNRLGLDYLYLGSTDKAAEQFRRALAIADDSSAAWLNLSNAYRRLGRLEEAQRVLDDPRARRLDSESIRVQRYMLAFLVGDAAAMQEQVKQSEGRPGYEDSLLFQQSLVAAISGRLAQSRALNARARAAAEKASGPGRTAVYMVNEALIEGYLGNLARARELAAQCLDLPGARNIVGRTALVLALGGDNVGATKLLQGLTANPNAILVQNYVAPTVRAHIEMNNGNPAKATEVLQAALPYDLAIAEFSALQPAYARGLAYLQLRKGPDATREFQKLIDNRGAVFDSILGALARLQRARARVVSGDVDGARTDYQDFLVLWKDADPDLPVLTQARAEYEALKSGSR